MLYWSLLSSPQLAGLGLSGVFLVLFVSILMFVRAPGAVISE